MMKLNEKINVVITNEINELGFLKLKKSGVKFFHFPMIKTLKSDINESINLSSTDSIIFTSKNGVKYFFNNLGSIKIDLSTKSFICIGKKTAHELENFGFKADYVCKRNYSDSMSSEIEKTKIINSKNALLVQGSLSNDGLYKSLNKFSKTKKIIVYQTKLVDKKYKNLEKLIKNKSPYVIFSSPSSFKSFVNFYNPSLAKIVSIGKTTTSYIESAGYSTVLTSKMQTFEGISDSLIKFLKKTTSYELS